MIRDLGSLVLRTAHALSDLFWEGFVFPLAGLRKQQNRPEGWWDERQQESDAATAEWLHNMDVKTRTEILTKAVRSKQDEQNGTQK